MHVRRTIDEVDPSLWDGIFASRGPMSHSVQRAMEAVFAGNGELGQDFEWRYVWITDREGEVVAATFFSIGHIKDDSFAAEAVSVEAEAIRRVLAEARIRPVITAHPTEAKRVTVLEIHRRIYRLLVDLESDRWTPRERHDLLHRSPTETMSRYSALRQPVKALRTTRIEPNEHPTITPFTLVNIKMLFY